ncbi:S9 family peptidase [Microbulbifer bruguierae]|uniref:S9 family peptidase n=1 Tax=Microbulbifer bruguierae TaxID=3029061 RepID=A0ABY8NDA4_9GAMM|nr:S9 family peptidase [Microbulbifer bruguierae]WGL16904.1 S9 family peptidase [Microbulbifer bruguierae]
MAGKFSHATSLQSIHQPMPETTPSRTSATCTKAPFGSWTSEISAKLLTSGNVRLSETCLADGRAYWLESRPAEKGRSVLVEYSEAQGKKDLLPAPLSVRSKAHEYGGGSFTVSDGWVYFVLAADQRIYRMSLDSKVPEPLTPEGPFRYADLVLDSARQRLICIQEDERLQDHEAIACIVAVNIHGTEAPQVLVEGADFYSNPAISPDHNQLSFLQWHHPNMPWDATELMLAELNPEGIPTTTRKVAGAPGESIFQPRWSPNGELLYVSDRNNWWNLYCLGDERPLWNKAAEFATPQWVFGMSTYGFLDCDTLFCTFSENGCWQLGILNLASGVHRTLEHPGCDFEGICCEDGKALFITSGPAEFPSIARYDTVRDCFETLASSSSISLPTDLLSHAQAIEYTVGERNVHAFYYPPCNPRFEAPEGELPPLIVFSHGGPTGATSAGLNLKVQYWTSRGFAILDVNYSGSTGYGRAYRDRLKDQWGILDVEDVCAGADFLVRKGLADPARLLIKGGSAGGYTVLAALTFHDTFSAGASHYGIGDLTTLARDTHKFESRYLDKLVGPWPEAEATYQARSPINHIEQLQCPVIFFQGMEDKVVPPNQAEAMVKALEQRGIPVAYITFADEGHGFRAASSIKMALEGELEFYSRICGFTLPQPGPGIQIANLPTT